MPDSSPGPGTQPCFELKAGSVTLTVLELHRFELNAIAQQLDDKVRQAPQFFQQTPVILALERLTEEQGTSLDFEGVLEVCRRYGLRPIAIRGGHPDQQQQAEQAGLPALAQGRSRAHAEAPARQAPEEATEPAPDAGAGGRAEPAPEPAAGPQPSAGDAASGNTRIVSRPVRSGQQIYAPGADLVVLSSVGAGAEILADGHIHVYGPLRGRALAGVRGDTEARIFCQNLEAELVSIAGHYQINERLRESSRWCQASQVHLDDEGLHIAEL